jgi:hypothetical protein
MQDAGWRMQDADAEHVHEVETAVLTLVTQAWNIVGHSVETARGR